MPELLTIEEFQDMFGEIDTPTAGVQIKRPLGVASRRVKSWVGESVFDAAVAAEDEDEIKLDLQVGVAYLAMHFLIANFNTVARPGGIVLSEKVEGDAVLTYLNPNQTRQRSQEFFELAEEICRPYLIENQKAGVEFVDYE